MLIASRALLGIAGATIAPSTLSLIRNLFEDAGQRTFAIGVWITAYSLGGAIGPILGGALLEFFWWGSVFLLAIPVMALLLVLGPFVLPEYRDPEAGRLDLLSAALSLLAVLAVVYGLKQMAQDGLETLSVGSRSAPARSWASRSSPGSGGSANPLIDLGPLPDSCVQRLRSPSTRSASSSSSARSSSRTSTCSSSPVCLRSRPGCSRCRRSSPSSSARWSRPLLVKRVSPAYVMSGGLLIGAVGFALMTQVRGRVRSS